MTPTVGKDVLLRRAALGAFAALALGVQPSNAASGSTPPKPILNTYRGPPASEAPSRVLVVRFGERVGAGGAGRAAAEMVEKMLRAAGLEVIAADAAAGADGAQLRKAQSLGADVAVLGTVTQWTRRQIETSDAWVSRRRTEVFVPGKQRVESQVALTARVLHVSSGRLAYSVSAHWSTPWEGEPEEAAERLLEAALDGWLSAWRKR